MDLVSIESDDPFPGELVGVTFADDEGGEPTEVAARVVDLHGDLIESLSGVRGTITWNPDTPQAQSWPCSWDED